MSGFILLGSPGSGKGTLAQYMKSLDIEPIGSGDILRREVREETEIGKQVKHLVREGRQVSDQLISEIVLKKLDECMRLRQSFVLDGFPQTLPQWEILQDFLAKHPDHPVSTICMEVEPETALKRMTGRLNCFQCESIYHQEMSPPAQEGTCDHCQIPLIKREGDAPEYASQRLEQFERTTKKVMEYVSGFPHVFSIDGNLPLQSVQSSFNHILKHHEI